MAWRGVKIGLAKPSRNRIVPDFTSPRIGLDNPHRIAVMSAVISRDHRFKS